jgi:two-component system, NarL family, invasion response regulator UvrY
VLLDLTTPRGQRATLCLSAKTVSTYRTRLLRKMGPRTNADLTRYALHHRLVS